MEIARTKLLLFLSVCFTLLPVHLHADTPDGGGTQYMQLVQWADEAVAQSNWDRAIACLQEAMRTEPANPQNVMLLSNMGMIQHYAGEDSLALHTLTEARAMAPASVVILKNRATVLTGMGRTDDAMQDYGKIIEMDSTYADAYQDRAVLFMRLNRYAEAETDIEKYRELCRRCDTPVHTAAETKGRGCVLFCAGNVPYGMRGSFRCCRRYFPRH